MVVIIGESGSGKTSIIKTLESRGFNRIISYTTRQPRAGEVDGQDYHFISEYQFNNLLKQNFFAEYTYYNGHLKGTALEDYSKPNPIAVLTPDILNNLKLFIDIKVVYIFVPEQDRIQRMLKRGDFIGDVYKKIGADRELFQHILHDADFIVTNYNLETTCQSIVDYYIKGMCT